MRARRPGEDAVLGFRVHTGWAAAVALAGPASSPRLVERRHLSLVDKTDHDSVFVYHAAAELTGQAVERHISAARRIAQANAHREMAQLLSDLKASGYSVRAVGLPRGSGRPLPSLGDILRSHPVIHTAEAELFRSALAEACGRHGLAVTGVASKELLQEAARVNGLRAQSLKRRLDELGRALGPPWAIDQKEAALAALVAAGEAKRSF
ncbi:MAG: hypothetical protein ACLPJH_06520 [Myxococcaceae bacterium]